MAVKSLAHFSVGRTIIFSIIGTIVTGTLLLALPSARTTSIPIIDLLFMATSATCVTGLFTVPIDQLTWFGQGVIMILMQIGGIGLITMSLFIMSLFVNIGLTTQFIAGKLLDINELHNIKKIIVMIICFTLGIELIGAVIIYFAIHNEYSSMRALFLALFHAVSSFCNAGISLFPGNMAHYQTHGVMLSVTMFLIITGGLGFITWRELFYNLAAYINGKRTVFSLQAKLILIGTAVSIAFLSLLFLILEFDHAFAAMGPLKKGFNALFEAVSMRSAGFLTVAVNQLHPASLMIIMLASFIGSAPCSTGGGIRITTFIILLATIKAGLSNASTVNIKGRQIIPDQLHKAITIISLSAAWIFLSILLLLITEPTASFIELALEAVSAFTNLGISTGITPHLSYPGKLFIMSSMLVGRIGSVTLILALKKSRKEFVEFSYPEERIMLG
jgi:trk system potassium uptake protein TrkH